MENNQPVRPQPPTDINQDLSNQPLIPTLEQPKPMFQDNKVRLGISLSSLGLLLFLAITFIAPLKSTLFSVLYPKSSSHAATTPFPDAPIDSAGVGQGANPGGGYGVLVAPVSANDVETIVADNTGAYISGNFSVAGPNATMGTPLNISTSEPVANFPRVVAPNGSGSGGSIMVALPDGKGGWFIGGNFEKVGSTMTSNLAHINADMSVDQTFNPGVNGLVDSMQLSSDGSTLYISGIFGTVGGQSRLDLATINTATGQVTSWNPTSNALNGAYGGINAILLTPDNSTLFVAGNFTSIGGQNRNYWAALDISTGNAISWTTTAAAPSYAGPTTRIVLSKDGKTLYANGGYYLTPTSTSPIVGPVAIDTTTGAINPNFVPGPTGIGTHVNALGLSPDGSTLYVGGNFSVISGTQRYGIAAYNTSTLTLTVWNPGLGQAYPNVDYGAHAVAFSPDGSVVYLAGEFDSVGGQQRYNLAAVSSSTGVPTSWNPGVGGPAASFAVDSTGTLGYVGLLQELESGLGASNLSSRIGLAKIKADGTVDPNFQPTTWTQAGDIPNNTANSPPLALSPDGSILYVSTWVKNLQALDASTGQPLSTWNASLKQGGNYPGVLAMAPSPDGTKLYVSGPFTTANGITRNEFAALDAKTGALLSWDPNAGCTTNCLGASVMKISPDGNTIYAGGNFTTINGQTRNYIAAIDANTGALLSWAPTFNSRVDLVALSSDGKTIYIGTQGSSTGVIQSFDTTTGTKTVFHTSTNYSFIYSMFLSPDNSTLYTGGSVFLRSYDSATGAMTCWTPLPNNSVDALGMSPDGSTLYAGGLFTTITHTATSNFAMFKDTGLGGCLGLVNTPTPTTAAATNTPTPTATPTPTPGTGGPTSTPTFTPTPTSSPSATLTPSPTPGSGGGPTNTPTPTFTPTPTPLPTNTPTPTFTPTPTPGSGGTIPTNTPTPTPIQSEPTNTLTPTPTSTQPGAPVTGFKITSIFQIILNWLNSIF